MTEAEVITIIQAAIVANGNNEITANVLRPVLIAMLGQPNDKMGELSDLDTTDKTNLVNAINEALANGGGGSTFTVHSGTDNPNTTPPASYSLGDWYIRNGTSIYQYNGSQWVPILNPIVYAFSEKDPYFEATEAQTEFFIDADTVNVDIWVGRTYQVEGQDYTRDEDTITMTYGLAAGDMVTVRQYKFDGASTDDYQLLSEKGEPNGYAPLDSGAKVPIEFLPDSGIINVKDYGVVGDGTTDDQVAIDALMENTNYSFFFFPRGIYRTDIDNTISNRTFIFEEGAIIDGVAHIAVGTGVDYNYNGISNEIVENTRVIGTLVSTVRVGTFYCKNLNIDKIRITDVDPSYINQTSDGGSRGVHFFMASKNIHVDEIIIESTTLDNSALGIDNHLTDDDIHYPENITINKLTIDNNILAGIRTRNTRNLFINTVIINSYDIAHGISHVGDLGLKLGNIKVDGINTTGVCEGVNIVNSDVIYGNLEVINSTNRGLRIDENSNVKIDRLISKNHVLEAVQSDGDFICNYIECSNSNNGIVFGNYDKNVIVENINAYDNTVSNCVFNGANKVIKNIRADNSGSFGVVINSTATNFYNEFLQSSNATQGLRCLSNDLTLGDIRLIDNEIGFQGSGIDKLSYKTIYYNNNSTYNTNTELDKVSNFKGRLYIPYTDTPYKVYTALLSQSGTSAPTAVILENTLGGTITWTRAGTGTFVGTLSGAFTSLKTMGVIQHNNNGEYTAGTNTVYHSFGRIDNNSVRVETINQSGTAADGSLKSATIEIRVYN